MDFGLIFDVFFDTFTIRTSSTTIFFPLNFNDFTLQRNMIFDDLPDLFRYQF